MYRRMALMLVAILGLLMDGCAKEKSVTSVESPSVPVTANQPTIRTITRYVEAIGILEPSLEIEIRPEVDGKLTKIIAHEGKWVEEDTPLFEIDSLPYQIRVDEGIAQLAIDQANHEAVQKRLLRIRPLAQKDLVSQTELEDMEAEAAKALAIIALDEARLRQAQLDLEHCTITSPSAGRVGKVNIDAGNLVSRTQTLPLVQIAKIDPLKVEFTLTEREFERLPGQNITFELTTLCTSQKCKKGELIFVDNRFDATTGLILAKGIVSNQDSSLHPGQVVQVRIDTEVISDAIVIPQKAIRYNPQGPYVYVVLEDQTVALRQLVLGQEEGKDQVVREGIDLEELIVIDGHLRISPGVKVEVKS